MMFRYRPTRSGTGNVGGDSGLGDLQLEASWLRSRPHSDTDGTAFYLLLLTSPPDKLSARLWGECGDRRAATAHLSRIRETAG